MKKYFDHSNLESGEMNRLSDLGIIGESDKIKELSSKISRIAKTDSTVLVTGASGTGKELMARALHKLSDRSKSPFIAINCAAIAESILESELFGFKKGAFTDAKKDRKGYFETCSDGTLFLDEIGEMSPSLQSKILRVLQEKEVTPLGSCLPVSVNTRIIAATNRQLKNEVTKKTFREDLYYRLAIFTITMPTLAERTEDIGLLINHFLNQYNERFGTHIAPPSRSALSHIKAHKWPGNIRELKNSVERAVILADGDRLSVDDMLPADSEEDQFEQNAADHMQFNLENLPLNYNQAKEQFEKVYINNLLKVCDGNVSEAAKLSGQYRPNVYRLINKFNIDTQQFKFHATH